MFTEGDEECDEGQSNGFGFCKRDCTVNECGDGYLGPGEACDDGNPIDNDECSNACTFALCGDGHIDPAEECDEGTENADDGACLTTCLIARCGDSHVRADSAEICDGRNINGYTCEALGFGGGMLLCLKDCTGFDSSKCIAGGATSGQ